MKEVKINGINYQFPSSWKDLAEWQLIKIHQFLERYQYDPASAIYILMIACGYKPNIWNVWFKKKEIQNLTSLPGEWLQTLIKSDFYLGFIFKPNQLLTYPVKKFTHRFRTYYGPHSNIINLKAIELCAAYSMFYYYTSKKEQIYLDKLVALLYRPAKPFLWMKKQSVDFDKDIRVKLNAYHWDKRAKRIKNLNHGLKLAIVRQFSSEWQLFEKKHKAVFKKSSAEGKYDHNVWIRILMELSGDIFGTIEEIKMHNAEEVFMKLNDKIEEAEEIKRNLKNKTI